MARDCQTLTMLSSDLKGTRERFSIFPQHFAIMPPPHTSYIILELDARLSVEWQFVRPLLCYHVELRCERDKNKTKTKQDEVSREEQ